MNVGVQLYTLRDVDLPVPDLLDRVADAGLDGVEFAYRLAEADDEAVAAALDRTGLTVAGAHVSMDALADDPAGVAGRYRKLGCDRLVVPAADESAFADRESVAALATRLDDLADAVAPATLCYHNHRFEFTDLGDETGFEALVSATDRLAFEFDTGLATHAGADAPALIERLDGRVPLLHLTDTVPGDDERVHATPGEGAVDLGACVAAARDAGAEWLLYEHGLLDPDEQLAHLEEAARLRELL